MTAMKARPPEPVDLSGLGSIPRDVRLTGGGITLLILASVLAAGAIAAGVALANVRARQQGEFDLWRSDGVAATGHVTGMSAPHGDDQRRTVTYAYDVAGTPFSGTAELRERQWRGLVVGDAVAVRALQSEPSRSWLAGHGPDVMPIGIIPLSVFGLLGPAGLLAWRIRRDWTLLSEGRLAGARVVATKKVARQHQRAHRVSYEFQTLSGATVTRSFETGRPPEVGASVPVVYHRDDPRRAAVYPLSLVKPAVY